MGNHPAILDTQKQQPPDTRRYTTQNPKLQKSRKQNNVLAIRILDMGIGQLLVDECRYSARIDDYSTGTKNEKYLCSQQLNVQFSLCYRDFPRAGQYTE